MTIEQLIQKYPLISEQVSRAEVRLVLQQLERVIFEKIPGAVVEFGCYSGTTSLFIGRYLQVYDRLRPFHVYDSFVGLPEKTVRDRSPAGEQFQAGELAVSKADFRRHFKHANLPLPSIHKSWFEELPDSAVPAPIALAFLDGDYYQSIATSLRLIEAKLSPDAVVIVDDYQVEALPGVKLAVDEWLARQPAYRLHVEASLAILTTERSSK